MPTADRGERITITDPDDERIALYRDLKDQTLRQREGLFLAESERVIDRLLQSSFEPLSALLTPERAERLAPRFSARGLPVFVAAVDVMSSAAGFLVHRGALALAHRGMPPLPANLLADAHAILALEDVTDPENVGSLFRLAAAFGVHGLLLTPGTVDPLYRKAIRASMGWSMHVPFARTSTLDLVSVLRQAGFVSVALTPAPDAVDIASVILPRSARVALVLGHEGDGLRPATLRAADVCVRIPIRAETDSINVAMAGAIAMHRLVGGHRPA